jgi:glucose/arabinose dehydrogenase/PKD repeat protein
MRPPVISLVILASFITLSYSAIAAHTDPQPPTGFVDEVVTTGFELPTAMAFAPDGRVFVAEKSGLVKVLDDLSDQTPGVFADLRTQVFNYWDRGLLGLAVDPQFPSRPYVYVLYAHDAPIGGTAPTYGIAGQTGDDCSARVEDGCIGSGRLSRLEMLPDGTWNGVETVLVEDWFQQFGSHATGALAFDGDGSLYASGGEGANWDYADYGQNGAPANPAGDPPGIVGQPLTAPTAEGGALRAQDLRTPADPVGLSGTVIRIDPDTGEGLPTNPLASSSDANARRIIAYGMRNPFRFALRPGTREVWIGDVGWRKWEEINTAADPTTLVAPVNFGWPCYEGSARQDGYEAAGLDICRGLYSEPGAVTFPVFRYRQGAAAMSGDTCDVANGSTSGLAFYGTGAYPAAYRGALFFADYSRNCIWVMRAGTDGAPDPATAATFIAHAASPTDLKIGPAGDLFYVDIAGGAIHRVRYDGGDAPRAKLVADRTSGPTPLTVTFDATGSTSPVGSALTFEWDLDDDGVVDATGATASYAYATAGSYSPHLVVRDAAGRSVTADITIVAGNTAPSPSIETPASTIQWRIGETIGFRGSAFDVEDGTLPDSALRWTLILNHCSSAAACHEHFLREAAGAVGTFVAPEHSYPSFLTLRLTATDNAGLEGVAEVRLDPQTVALQFDSEPQGVAIATGDEVLVTPARKTVIAGSHVSLAAPASADIAGAIFDFEQWSDAGPAAHVFVADAPATLVASYVRRPSTLSSAWTARDVGATGLTGTATENGGVMTVRGAGADVWDRADAFQFVWQPLTGDGSITAQVTSLSGTASWAKAGVMFRGTEDVAAAHAFMLVSQSRGLAFQRRTAAGGVSESTAGPMTAAPMWVRLTRSGTRVTADSSPDGVTWTTAGVASVALPATALVGLAVTAHDASSLATATFDHVVVAPAPPPPPSNLPGDWSDGDVGDVGLTGFTSVADNVFSVIGAGADIWDRADAFRFVAQPLTGDGTVTARVATIGAAASWTKAGVMIRASRDAAAAHAMVVVSGAKGVAFQRRSSDGALSTSTAGPAVRAPYWLRLTRRGSTITAFASADGVAWTTVGSDTVALPATALVGLVVSSHDAARTATGTFDNVQISDEPWPALVPLPDGWTDADIGPTPNAGDAGWDGSEFSVSGGGADVWDRADAFHFVARDLTGDGRITAHVAAVSGAAAWTKAGVMIRAGAAADAAHAFMLVSVGKGTAFQRRIANAALSSSTPGPILRAPCWVRLERVGNTVTASVSQDGLAWTIVGTDTIDLPGVVRVGLAVTAHDAQAVATAVFDQVEVVAGVVD